MPAAILAVVAAAALAGVIALDGIRRRQAREMARREARARLSHALAEGLTEGGAVEDALRLLVPDHADWCALHLVEGARVRRAAVVHVDPQIEQTLRQAFLRVPFVADVPVGPAQVIRTGRPEIGAEITAAMLAQQPDPAVLRLAGAGGFLSVPIKSRHATIGALTLHARMPRAYDERDVRWAADVACRIGLSIENRRLYVEAKDLFEQSVSANFVTRPDGTIVACNERFAELLGFASIEEALATPVTSLYVDPAMRSQLLARLRAGTRLTGRELALRRRDGRILTVLADAVGEFDETGELLQTRGFLIDRTGQKILEEQLRQAQRLESIGQLAGGIAHDFNNLLTIIIGCADLLRLDNASTIVDDHDPLDELMKAAKRAAALTHQLLAFSRRQVLQPRVVQLNDAIRAVHPLLRRLVPPGVELVLNLGPDVERVQVDPGQLDQVVINLVVNSADATPGTGTITVGTASVAISPGDADDDPCVRPGRYVALTVTDTGGGMDEATRARVFEPFFTTKAVGKGTGLGLSTVYGIVKQSGGYVWITSAPGAGTSVKVCLPVVAEAAATI